MSLDALAALAAVIAVIVIAFAVSAVIGLVVGRLGAVERTEHVLPIEPSLDEPDARPAGDARPAPRPVAGDKTA